MPRGLAAIAARVVDAGHAGRAAERAHPSSLTAGGVISACVVA